jgi:hypothetical protein
LSSHYLSRLRGDTRTVLIAMATAVLVAAAPAVAGQVVDYARRSGKVDGRNAVAPTVAPERRAGSLIAANASGKLPRRVLGTPLNAKKVGGFRPDQIVRASVAKRLGHISGFRSPGWATVHGARVTAPTDGVLLLWGQFAAAWDDDSEPGAFAGLGSRLTVDERVAGHPQIVEIDRSTRAGTTPVFLSGALPVKKGSHRIRIQARRTEGSALIYLRPRQTTTIFVPFGNDGEAGRL